MIYIRKNNSKLFLKLRELKAEYTQHAEVGENGFLLWKTGRGEILFRACTVAYAKAQNAKDFGKDTNAFLSAINSL